MRKVLPEELVENSDIIDILSEYLDLKKAGANYKASCPFHSEKTASFIVSPVKQIYKCFGCGAGGNVVSFLKDYLNMSYWEALKLLARRMGVELKSKYSKGSSNKYKKILEANRTAALFYMENLQNSPEALNYLSKRKISSRSIQEFGLGLSLKSNPLLKQIKRKKLDIKDFIDANLIRKSSNGRYFEFFNERLIFPIRNINGDTLGFGGRIFNDQSSSTAKYINSPENAVYHKGSGIFGINLANRAVRDAGNIILAEGYVDVIALHQYGFKNSAACLGTAITDKQSVFLKRLTDDCILALDGDNAGLKAAMKNISVLLENDLDLRIAVFPEGDDPHSFLVKYGIDEMNEVLENSLDLIGFIDLFVEKFNKQGEYKSKVQKFKLFSELAGSISDPIKKRVIVEMASAKWNESFEVLESFIKTKTKRVEKISSAQKKTEDKTKFAEERLIKILFNHPNKRSRIIKDLNPELFSSENKVILDKLLDILSKDIDIPTNKLLMNEEFENLHNKFTEILDNSSDLNKLIDRDIESIEFNNIKNKVNSAPNQIKESRSEEDQIKILEEMLNLKKKQEEFRKQRYK